MVVLGAGPGGLACAIAAATAGLSVVVLDARPVPRDRPGETLHPGVEALFRQLGVDGVVAAARFHRHQGIQVERPGEASRLEPYGADDDGPWLGFQAPGTALDGLLADRAKALGVSLRAPASVRDAIFDHDGVRLSLSDRTVLSAGTLVDASGTNRWLARRLGLQSVAWSRPLLSRWWAEPAGGAAPTDPVLTLKDDGWLWRAPIDERTVSLCAMTTSLDRPDAGVRARDVSWLIQERTAGPGWWLVGDAACMLDPLAGKGVLKAMMSGILAAWLFTKVRDGEIDAAAAAAEYHDRISRQFDQDRIALAAAYRAWSPSLLTRIQP
jgi:flavin-dependent dehydrogenase